MANRRFIDFPIAASVGNNDIVLIWQDGLNKQTTKATLFAGSPSTLASLTDVDISALTNGQILQYNSTTSKWENVDRTDIDLDQLGDVTIVSPTNGQVLVYNSSTSKWENSSGGFVPYTGAVTTVNLGAQTIQAGSFVKAGGTAAQFLKANGSVDSTAYGTGSVTSVALTMPSAFSVANSPITTAGTLAVTGAGTVAQYVRGDGSLADFPESSGGGSSVSYYLNGSVSQGTIGGVAYLEMNKVPILGAGTDFTRNSNGYIASFITDAGDPNLLEIPGGNWNFESYFSASSGGGSPTFYVELYKVNSGGTATLIASNSANPELISFGTTIAPYFSSLAVPTTVLALTDRLAVRYYVTPGGRTLTLHTEGPHLCQIITTFTTGITALNGLTAQVQNFAVGTSGTDFNIASATATHTFNLPTASDTNRGALSSADWTTFNNKENAITAGTTAQYYRGDKTFQTLNTSVVPELTNLYYTEARVSANTDVAANTAARHNAVTLGTSNGLSLSTQQLSLGLASAGVTGALSGTDWSTFNSKQNALTNPVTGTGTTNYLPKFTGSTTIGNSQIFDNGTNVGIGTALPNRPLDVLGSIRTQAGTIDFSNSFDNQIWFASGVFNFKISGSERMYLNSLGNLGLGVTPSAWDLGRTLQIGSTFGTINYSGTSAILGIVNAFYNGSSYVRQNTGSVFSLEYNISVGNALAWRMGEDSTSGTTTTLSPVMALFNNGNLFVGTSPSDSGFKLDVNGTGRFVGNLTASSFIRSGGTSSQFLKADGSVDSNSYYLASNPSAFIALTALSGTAPIQYNNTTGAISITQASGSTNGFLSSTDWNTFNNKTSNVGTVTSVAALTLGTSGTDLSSSVANGTTTPVITLNVPTASAANRGALSAADWTTFNSKQNALTNPVTGTGTTNTLPKFTGASTIGNSQIFDDGTNIGIGTVTPTSFGAGYTVTSINGSSGGGVLDLMVNNTRFLTLAVDGSEPSISGRVSGLPIVFKTNNAGTVAERMRIFSDGNVFIGSSSSNAGFKLDVNGTGRFSSTLRIDGSAYPFLRINGNSTTGSGGGIQMFGNTTQYAEIYGEDESTNNGRIFFRTRRAGTITDALRLTSSGNGILAGNLGVGTELSGWSLGRVLQIGGNNSAINFSGTSAILSIINTFFNGSSYVRQNTGASASFEYGLARANSFNWRMSGEDSSGTTASLPIVMSLSTNGNLSINNTNDTFRLDVTGTARFSGQVTGNSFVPTESTIPTNGMYLPSANTIAFSTNTTERMSITSDGNVLIGTGSANSRLQVAGSFATPHTTKSANYTLDATDYTVGFDCASNRTATLPDATTCAGRIYVIYQYNTNIGVRYVTLDGNGSQTIDGVTTYSLMGYQDFSSVMIQSNGSNWIVIADKLYPPIT